MWRITFGLTVAGLALLAPLSASGQTTTTVEPRARYFVEARVIRVNDEVLDQISYLRAQLTLVDVQDLPQGTGTPRLGAGSTLTAMVRDPKLRSVIRALGPTASLPLELGWYDQQAYEVLRVLMPTPATARSSSTAVERNAASQRATLLLLVTLLAFSVLALVLLRHYD